MSIAFVQVTSAFSGNASLTVNVTISGVVQGDTIKIPFFHENFSSNGTTISASDSQGQTVTLENRLDRANTYTIGIWSIANANSGTHVVTLTSSSGTAANNFWRAVGLEYSGSPTIDQVGHAQSGASTGPLSATSGAPLASTADLVLAVAFAESATSGWAIPAGYTSRYKDSTLGVAELLPAGVTTAVTANFGSLSGSAGWDVIINTYASAGVNYSLAIATASVPIVYEPITLVYSQPQHYLLLVNTALVPVLFAPAFADYALTISELAVPISYKNVGLVYTPAGGGGGASRRQPLIIGIGIFV